MNHKVKQDVKEIDEIYSEELQKKLLFLKQRYYEMRESFKLLSYRLRKQRAD